jgi:glycosyltransferase involved in cell wall biosynthesis
MASDQTNHGTLLVVGDTNHALDQDGRLCTFAALARQLDQWFDEFDRVQIAAVMLTGEKPADFEPYEHEPIELVPLRAAGGSGLRAKLGAVAASASWIWTLIPLLRRADVVHLRAPCNVTLVAIPLARVLSRRRYAIYAGAWDPPAGGPITYRVQRWMLQHFGGVVHVYAPSSDRLGANLRPNFSPTFTADRLRELTVAAERRLERIRAHPPSAGTLRVACVGRFSTNKNQVLVVRALADLRAAAIPVEVRFAGSGGTEAEVRALAETLDLTDDVTFLGRCDEAAVMALYEWADVTVCPTFVEGFGRVILESMAVGCPVVSGPGTMQQAMVAGGRGVQIDPNDPSDLAKALEDLRAMPVGTWEHMSLDTRAYAGARTIEAFHDEVRSTLEALGASGR